MIIKKIVIDNFKSINRVEIPFDKVGNSFTKIFVGINESGKSNILEALSYFDVPEEKVSFDTFCNQKNEDSMSCDICFSIDFEEDEEDTLQRIVNDAITSDYHLEFTLANIVKKVYLSKESSTFEFVYDYDVILNSSNLYVKLLKVSGKESISIVDEQQEENGYEILTPQNFDDYFMMSFLNSWKNMNHMYLYGNHLASTCSSMQI